MKDELVLLLLLAVGKLALREGEQWRLDHAELMDAYQACQDELSQEIH